VSPTGKFRKSYIAADLYRIKLPTSLMVRMTEFLKIYQTTSTGHSITKIMDQRIWAICLEWVRDLSEWIGFRLFSFPVKYSSAVRCVVDSTRWDYSRNDAFPQWVSASTALLYVTTIQQT